MLINSIYPTISGEVGVVIPQGSPCLLVRTQKCNLKCWYCDASETQSSKGGYEEPVANIVQMAKEKSLPILLTGGEPLLQEDVGDLITICYEENVLIQIETNGTIKIPESDNPDAGYILDYKNGQDFVNDFSHDLNNQDYVKFVVENKQDLIDVHSIIKDYNQETFANWAISPVQGIKGAITPKEVGEYILDNKIPAVLNVQLHKFIDMS